MNRRQKRLEQKQVKSFYRALEKRYPHSMDKYLGVASSSSYHYTNGSSSYHYTDGGVYVPDGTDQWRGNKHKQVYWETWKNQNAEGGAEGKAYVYGKSILKKREELLIKGKVERLLKKIEVLRLVERLSS